MTALYIITLSKVVVNRRPPNDRVEKSVVCLPAAFLTPLCLITITNRHEIREPKIGNRGFKELSKIKN